MTKALENIKAYFDSKGIRYQEGKSGDAILVSFNGLKNAGAVEIIVVADEGDGSIGLRSFNLPAVNDDVKPKMYKVCSDLNDKFRWAKFYVDEERNSLTVADDAVIQLDSVGEEAYELVMRMVSIIDEAYPDLMKARFA